MDSRSHHLREHKAAGAFRSIGQLVSEDDPNSDPECPECGHVESSHRAQIDGGTCGAAGDERCGCRMGSQRRASVPPKLPRSSNWRRVATFDKVLVFDRIDASIRVVTSVDDLHSGSEYHVSVSRITGRGVGEPTPFAVEYVRGEFDMVPAVESQEVHGKARHLWLKS